MTKADRNRFYIYAVLQSKCGIGVAEIVKTNFRKTDAFNNRLEAFPKCKRGNAAPYVICEHKFVRIDPKVSGPKAFFHLNPFLPAQCIKYTLCRFEGS